MRRALTRSATSIGTERRLRVRFARRRPGERRGAERVRWGERVLACMVPSWRGSAQETSPGGRTCTPRPKSADQRVRRCVRSARARSFALISVCVAPRLHTGVEPPRTRRTRRTRSEFETSQRTRRTWRIWSRVTRRWSDVALVPMTRSRAPLCSILGASRAGQTTFQSSSRSSSPRCPSCGTTGRSGAREARGSALRRKKSTPPRPPRPLRQNPLAPIA